MTSAPLDLRRKKLLYRARYRGFKEADMLIGGFAATALPAMNAAEMDAFEALLLSSDHDLYEWIVGNEPPPPGVDRSLILRLKAHDAAVRADK